MADASRNSSSSPRRAMRNGQARPSRRRTTIACNACRARRTKCDSRRPSCSYCHSHRIQCEYQDSPSEAPSKVELELASINQRLDHLTTLITTVVSGIGVSPGSAVSLTQREEDRFSDEEKAPFELLVSRSIMRALDLDPNFMTELAMLERGVISNGSNGSHRFCIVQTQQAVSALATFAQQIHIWYPIFRTGFSETYFRIISGPLPPSAESSLVLLVAAIGTLSSSQQPPTDDRDRHDIPFVEAALSALPIILAECSISSIQCLILLSIYYCCLLKSCQAHDYVLIASFKIQNYFKNNVPVIDDETKECLARAYWAILLLESELKNQLEAPDSGIWDLNEDIPLPDSSRTWHFDAPMASHSPGTPITPQHQDVSMEAVDAYFLAEISMRRMLHRCNTAIRRTQQGTTAYAPRIASELVRQLDEWHNYLLDPIKFDPQNHHSLLGSPLTNFLHVQYHCYRISTFWPATYQAMQDPNVDEQLLEPCRHLLDSYMALIPSLNNAINECAVNRWTLFTTMFVTSMAVLKIVSTPWLRNLCSPQLLHVLSPAGTAHLDLVNRSPSLHRMNQALRVRLENTYNPFDGVPLLSNIVAGPYFGPST